MISGRATGASLLALITCAAALAPGLTSHRPIQRFPDFVNAPPMRPHIVGQDGNLSRPFIYPIRLVDLLEGRYEEDTDHPIPIRWFADGVVVSVDESRGPWLPLGADPLGRDVLARLLYGARLSLGLACTASLGALMIGLAIGGVAGFYGGWTDRLLMALADFIIVLPAMYVVLSVRAALPLVLTATQVFLALTIVLTLAGWPLAARGVRVIVAAERRKAYAEAAYALGARPWRILLRHVLPSTTGFLVTTGMMMVPAFALMEVTLSLVGLGFPTPTATWGAMLRDAWERGAITNAPWLMAPAAALVLTVLALHLLSGGRDLGRLEPAHFRKY